MSLFDYKISDIHELLHKKEIKVTDLVDERVALEVSVGDRIIFSKYSGTEVKFEGNEYLILRENDILAVVGE
jgi:co-chaperonin GroES (HSP10)